MRVAGWEARLTAWAARRVGAPFAWGSTDCALLAMEAFDALTGRCLALAYRGLWSSTREALRYARGADLVQTFVHQGCAVMAPAEGLRVGDFLMVKGSWWCAHVCFGARVLSSWPDQGVLLGDTRALLPLAPLVLRVPFRGASCPR